MFARLAAGIALVLTTPSSLAQPTIGDRSPELGIEELLNAPPGTEATLESLRGKFVVLEFWATWCGPCVGAIPHLNQLHETYKDRVRFISVTDEDRDIVGAFQENEPAIANWIGIDSDRSLFDAYKIRGIPTTIILDAEGQIVARTHPVQLTAERMDAYLAGHRDTPTPRTVPVAKGGDSTTDQLRARRLGGLRPGVDPYHISDTPPSTVLIIRKSLLHNEGNSSAWAGTSASMLNARASSMLQQIYALPTARLDLTAFEDDTEEYDLIFAGVNPDLVKAEVLRTLGLQEHREQRRITGYRLIAAPTGLRNTTTLRAGGFSASSDSVSITLTGASMPAKTLAMHIEARLVVPVEIGIDPDTMFKVNLKLPHAPTPEEIIPILVDALGLTLEAFEADHEVVVIRPLAPNDRQAD